MASIDEYLSIFQAACLAHNGAVVARLISVDASEIVPRAQFPVPTSWQLQRLADAKWQNLVAAYFKLVNAIVVRQDVAAMLDCAIELVENLNRCAERQDNWILPVLYSNTRALKRMYRTKMELKPDDTAGKQEQFFEEKSNSLHQMARVVSTTFQICLNDRNQDVSKSKRQGVYYFIDELFKIYSVLQNHDLARSTEKAFKSLRHELPQIEEIKKSHAVTYLYFSGAISCAENDLPGALDKLTRALELCSKRDHAAQIQSILVLLVPVKFLATGQYPSDAIWSQYPVVRHVYYQMFRAIKTGDLKKFDRELRLVESVVLKRQLYVMVMKLRSHVTLHLFRKVWELLDRKPHVPVSAFQLALEYASTHKPVGEGQFKYSIDAAESCLARMIATGAVKGYLSHGNRIAVVSKQNPFPQLH